MQRKTSKLLGWTVIGLAVAGLYQLTASAEPNKGDGRNEARGDGKPDSKPDAKPAHAGSSDLQILESTDDEAMLSAQDREIRDWAVAAGAECQKVLEQWIASRSISEEKLFARLYYPIPKTDPQKFSTDYDALADRDIAPIIDRYLTKSAALAYVVLNDINGYTPTHNQKFRQPLTGNPAVDLVNNRSKRIYMNLVGFRSARSESPFLLQVYERDTGERVMNFSVPVRVNGKHWGAVRFGYAPSQK